jgi:hypothetical protein
LEPPAANVKGILTLPSTEKDGSENSNLETSTECELEFSKDIFELPELPTLTVPNSTVVGVAAKLGWSPEP